MNTTKSKIIIFIALLVFTRLLYANGYIYENCGDVIHWKDGDRIIDLKDGIAEIRGLIDYDLMVTAKKIILYPGSSLNGSDITLKITIQ